MSLSDLHITLFTVHKWIEYKWYEKSIKTMIFWDVHQCDQINFIKRLSDFFVFFSKIQINWKLNLKEWFLNKIYKCVLQLNILKSIMVKLSIYLESFQFSVVCLIIDKFFFQKSTYIY